MKMEQPRFSETSVPIYLNTLNDLPKYMTLHPKSQRSDYITLSYITSKVMFVFVQVTCHQRLQVGLSYDPYALKVLHAPVVHYLFPLHWKTSTDFVWLPCRTLYKELLQQKTSFLPAENLLHQKISDPCTKWYRCCSNLRRKHGHVSVSGCGKLKSMYKF